MLRATYLILLILLATVSLCWFVTRSGEYRVLQFIDGDLAGRTASATVEPVNLLGLPRGKKLQIECYGSLDKDTNLSDPGFRTSPDKPGIWTGAVGTKHWMDSGCRPLPIGFNVRFGREKYPANYLDYDTAQEAPVDTFFGHSYWKIVSEN